MARMDPHTMIEIRNYKHPPVIVHDVMTSTYLLLGERKDDLEVCRFFLYKRSVVTEACSYLELCYWHIYQ